VAIERRVSLIGVAVGTFLNQNRAHAGRYLGVVQERRVRGLRRKQTRIPKGVHQATLTRGSVVLLLQRRFPEPGVPGG
jgi:hypothetical protein